MHIGINGQYLLKEHPAGPERFTLNLIRALTKIDSENAYTIYFCETPAKPFITELINNKPNFKYKIVKKILMWTQISLAKQLLIDKPDVFLSTIHTIPFIKPSKTRFVTMIHGLEYMTNKEYADNKKKLFFHKLFLQKVIKNSNILIVPSQATRDAIMAQYPDTAAKKLMTIFEGVGAEFKKYPSEQTAEIATKYGLNPNRYVLSISTLQPRKNYIRLITAFANLIKNNAQFNDLQLAIAGKLGWQYEEILETPNKLGIEKNVKFLNWVEQKDLPILLSGCSVYTNVSIEEGFGLTLLEAMASEVPVVVSAIPAHVAIAKNTVCYVKPLDVAEIEATLHKVLSNNFDRQIIENAKKITQQYTWEQCAQNFIAVFNSLMFH